jgi:hypothetical protein
MVTFTKLPSRSWRAQIRRAGQKPIGLLASVVA